MSLFSRLPLEILQHIISYNGTLKYRAGKWMGQINQKDKRLRLYNKIPKPLYTPRDHKTDFHITLQFVKKKHFKIVYIFSHFYDRFSNKPFDASKIIYHSKFELDFFYKKEDLENNDNKEMVYLWKSYSEYDQWGNPKESIWIRR